MTTAEREARDEKMRLLLDGRYDYDFEAHHPQGQVGWTNLNHADFVDEHDLTPVARLRPSNQQVGNVTHLLHNLETKLVQWIGRFDVVIGCVAYLTLPRVLIALAQKRMVLIFVAKDDFLRPDCGAGSAATLLHLYADLPGAEFRTFSRGFNTGSGDDPLQSIMCVGNRPKERAPSEGKMHHKFFVGGSLTADRNGYPEFHPASAWVGSFNPTLAGVESLDSANVFDDPATAAFYAAEHAAMLGLAEPLNWKHPWVAPVHRLGT